jgi:hypothetical protein
VPLGLHEHVDDEINVIHEDPLGAAPAFDVVGADVEVLGQALLDGVGDGQDLPLRRTVADHEEVGEIAEVSEVEDDDILGLLVPGGLDARGEFGSQRAASSRYKPRSRI